MRKFLKLFALVSVSLVFLAVVVAVAVHREFDGVTMFVDNELVTGPLIAIAIVVVLAIALFIAFVFAIAAIASAAILVPLVIGFALVVAIGALFVGLAPLLIPVLLVVGACVLLVRLFKRPRAALPAPVIDPRMNA
jgi:hypothetical protein